MGDVLKELIDGMHSVLSTLDCVDLGLSNENRNAKSILQYDLISYILYLSNSDGRVSKAEKDFLSMYSEMDWTYDEIKSFINEHGINSEEFKSKIPLSVQMVVIADNKLYEERNQHSGCRMIYDFYKVIGQAVLACDKEVGNNEIEALSQYLGILKEYINSNCENIEIIKDNSLLDAQNASNMICDKEEFDDTAIKKIMHENAVKKELEEQEFEAKLNNRHDASAPWDTQYFDYPCPYCGKYKVRYAKWEDKQMSTAFWGAFSRKLHCNYKCDSCREMWE